MRSLSTRPLAFVTVSRWCVCAALFFSPWILQWTIPGTGRDSLLVAANVPKLRLADMLAALSIGFYALGGWPGWRRVWRQQRVWCWSLLGLMAIGALSVLWAMDALLASMFALHLGLWVLLAVRVASDDLPPRSIALSLLAGLLINSVVGLVQFWLQRSVGLTLLGELPLDATTAGMSVIGNDTLHVLRLYGLSGHPNVMGGFAAVALVWSLGLIARSLRRGLLFSLGAWLLGWLTLLFAFSRSAWLGMSIALGVITVLIFRRQVYRIYRSRVLALVGLMAITLVLLVIMFQPLLIDRLTVPQTSTLESTSIIERIDLMQAAIKLIEWQPLTGVGVGNFIPSSQALIGPTVELDWVHNVPLLIASELGLPGLLLWLINLAALGLSIIRNYRRGTLGLWRIAAACSIVTMLVIMLFDHYWWTSSQGVYVWAVITGWMMSNGTPTLASTVAG